VEDEIVGAIALPRAQRARDRGGDADAHAAVGRLQDQHHPGERERSAGQRIGADAAQEEPVERDHARECQQVEHVGRRQRRSVGMMGASRSIRVRGGTTRGGVPIEELNAMPGTFALPINTSSRKCGGLSRVE
jgi:hypothetical protein